MGFLRKTLLLGTAGLAPVNPNSKKDRAAKASEKQLRLMKQAQKDANRSYNVTCPSCRAALKAPAGQRACPKCGKVMTVTPKASLR
jgi:ssDNA-binding Zn-finger/Zn-ribbon topoisomerase 1